jgi:photosystem II stability/assembly factor-like uncharacterized protein
MKKQIFTIFLSLFIQVSLNAQWVQQYTGTTADLRGISFLNENTGYVCGAGTILKTTNGGINWVNINSINLLKLFTKIQAIDENIVYCVGMFNTIIKSTNGGANWDILRNGPDGTGFSLFALYFINTLTGWIGGQDNIPYLFKTTNGGITFDSIPTTNLDARVQDFYFINASTGLGCNDNGKVRKTTDGGYNWNNVNIPIGTYLPDFKNFSFINNSTGFTCTNAKKVFKTTDFGYNWDSLSYIPNTYPSIHHICFRTESKGWAAGSGFDVFHTTNGGLNWNAQGGGGCIQMFFVNDSVGYKTGNIGLLHKTTNGGVTTYVANKEVILQNFNLSGVYPNPFNSQTIITYNIFKNDYYTLELYNMLGKREVIIFAGQKNAGEHKYNFAAKNLTSGVYILKLSNASTFLVKKLVLMK